MMVLAGLPYLELGIFQAIKDSENLRRVQLIRSFVKQLIEYETFKVNRYDNNGVQYQADQYGRSIRKICA
mgnify:CR=1 FL=1